MMTSSIAAQSSMLETMTQRLTLLLMTNDWTTLVTRTVRARGCVASSCVYHDDRSGEYRGDDGGRVELYYEDDCAFVVSDYSHVSLRTR